MAKYVLTITEMQAAARAVAEAIAAQFSGPVKLYGVPRGGIACAFAVAACNPLFTCCDTAEQADCFVDDIYDSGRTVAKMAARHPGTPLFVLFDKRVEPWKDRWMVMPYEVTLDGQDKSIEDAQTRLQQYAAGTAG